MFEKDQPIRVKDPDGDGEIAATFLAPGEPEDAIEGLNGVKRDVAWVQYDEGERGGSTGQHPYAEIRPA